jgi:hypothetical protein
VTAEKSGLVVVTWNHDGRALDTGFRPRRKADTARGAFDPEKTSCRGSNAPTSCGL